MALAESKVDLLKMIDKEGPEGLCFRTQLDIRLATSSGMTESYNRGAKEVVTASSQQDTQDSDRKTEASQDCQFQAAAAQTALGKAYDPQSRPVVRKVLRLANVRAEGSIYPISSVYSDIT